MIEKKLQLIITFYTTADAIATEKCFNENKIEGRLISVPRQISAGCGMAWKSDVKLEKQIKSLIEKNGLSIQEIVNIKL